MIIVTGAQGGIGTALLNDLKKLNQPCLAITTSEIPKDTNDLIEYVRVAKSGDDQTLYEEYLNIFKKHGSQTTGVALLHGVVYYADRKDGFLQTFRKNIEGNLLLTNVIIRAFLASRELNGKNTLCSVVLVGTASANRGGRIDSNPGYAVAKYALQNLVKAYGKSHADTLCRFNCVALGFIDSGLHGKNNSMFSYAERVSSIPMGRAGSVTDASSVIRFLLSSDSEFINGQTLSVDGGDFI